MKDIHYTLTNELKKIDIINKKAITDIEGAPNGNLRISHCGGTNQYYHVEKKNDTHGKYIKKEDIEMVEALAQKSYAQKFIPEISKYKKLLEKVIIFLEEDSIGKTYDGLSDDRKELITPYFISDHKYCEKWIEAQRNIKEEIMKKNTKLRKYDDENLIPEIYTEKGERVRSKSEKILADKFNLLSIPYAYEIPLFLKGYGYIRPDFKLLNARTRKEYIWEHLGMMDDRYYAEKSVKKIELYERNNIFVGDGLILTFETRDCPLNMKNVELLIEKYLI